MSQFPKIKVDFVIEGKNLDIEKLTKNDKYISNQN